jgi:outer membrane receptor protein involved in Fe transport
MARAAVFIQDEWSVTGAWSLSAGLRWETLRTEVTPRGGASVTQRTTVASPLLQTLYKASQARRWRASLSRTYKNPTMMELIPRRYTVDNGNSPADPDNQGNPRLRPELAWGLDAGVEQDVGQDGTVAAGLYRRRIDGVNVPLLFNDGGRWVRMPANQGRADAWGLSADVKAALGAAWTVRAHAARDWSRVAAIPGPANRLARQTPRSAGAGVDWRVDEALTVGADMAWQDGGWSRWSAALAELVAPSRKLDVYAAWRLDGASRLRISGANLLRPDAHTATVYADAAGERRLAETARGVATWRIHFEHRW